MTITLTTQLEKRHELVVFNGEAVAGTATVTSDGFQNAPYEHMGIYVQATSVLGTPSVQVLVEFAPVDTAAKYVQLEGGSIHFNITDENPHVDVYAYKVNLVWARIKIIGQAGNPSDTLVDVVVTRD